MGALRVIAIVLIVIYGLRFLMKLLSPWLMKKAQQKMQNMAQDQMRQRGFDVGGKPQRPEGSVTVEKVTKTKSSASSKSTDDEYVDFEEIK